MIPPLEYTASQDCLLTNSKSSIHVKCETYMNIDFTLEDMLDRIENRWRQLQTEQVQMYVVIQMFGNLDKKQF